MKASASDEGGFHDPEMEEEDEEELQTPNCQHPRDGDSFTDALPPMNIGTSTIESVQHSNTIDGGRITTDDLEMRRAEDKRRLIGQRMMMKGEHIIFELTVRSHPLMFEPPYTLLAAGGDLKPRTATAAAVRLRRSSQLFAMPSPPLLLQNVCQLTNYRMIVHQVPGTKPYPTLPSAPCRSRCACDLLRTVNPNPNRTVGYFHERIAVDAWIKDITCVEVSDEPFHVFALCN